MRSLPMHSDFAPSEVGQNLTLSVSDAHGGGGRGQAKQGAKPRKFAVPKLNVAVLIFDDVEELDAVGPYQVFGTASAEYPDRFSVCTVAERDGQAIRAVNGLRMLPDHGLAAAPPVDILVIPGGIGTKRVATNEGVVDWIRRTASTCQRVASVCSGARLTLAAGLATGRRITTHWGVVEELRAGGQAKEVLDDVRFVRDGNLVHAAGVSAGIDMALWLVGDLHGAAAARRVQKELEYYPAPPHAFEV